MLNSLLQLAITTPDDPNAVNMADSLKTNAVALLDEVKSDPGAFVSSLIEQGTQFGLKVLAAIAIYIVGAWVIKRIKKLLKKVFEKRKTDGAIASFVSSLVSITLTLFLIILVVSALGVNTTSFAALLAAGGMAIGMALSGTVQNFAGGIMILLFKPFKSGDFISAQGFSGVVTDVTIASTKILTVDNRVVVIPNGALSNGNIDNYSTMPLRRVDWKISVAYGSDADKVIDTITAILKADSRVLDATTKGADNPFVALLSLDDSTISFTVRAWVKGADYWGVNFDINKAIYTELPKHGIEFAFPHVDVTVKNS